MQITVSSLYLFTFLSCSIIKQAEGKGNSKINIVSSVEIPFNQNSKNTLIGGLSSIDYDPKGTLLFICDDRAFTMMLALLPISIWGPIK
jgi:hypothetical protein